MNRVVREFTERCPSRNNVARKARAHGVDRQGNPGAVMRRTNPHVVHKRIVGVSDPHNGRLGVACNARKHLGAANFVHEHAEVVGESVASLNAVFKEEHMSIRPVRYVAMNQYAMCT